MHIYWLFVQNCHNFGIRFTSSLRKKNYAENKMNYTNDAKCAKTNKWTECFEEKWEYRSKQKEYGPIHWDGQCNRCLSYLKWGKPSKHCLHQISWCVDTFLGNISVMTMNGIGTCPIILEKTINAKHTVGIHWISGWFIQSKQ